MTCELCSGTEAALRSLTNELKSRESELVDLSSKFNKHKLQSKAKVTQLRQQLAELIISENELPDDEQSTQSKLSRVMLKLDDAETELARNREEVEKYRSMAATKDTQIADHLIRIKLLEEQLELTDSVRKHSEALEKNDNSPSTSAPTGDLQASVYAQLVYKDTKILELNNQILAKDRQILDLQESCRERQEVADAKSKAIQILQSQIVRMAPRDKSDASTETDFHSDASSSNSSLHVLPQGRNFRDNRTPSPAEDAALSSSPGRAIAIVELPRTGSPPPADPALDEMSSVTTESALDFYDFSRASSSRTMQDLDSVSETTSQGTASSSLANPYSKAKKKPKKRVTWDLSEQEREQEIKDLKRRISDLEASNQELSEENEELRSTIGEVEVALDDAKVLETDWELKYKLIETQAEQLQEELDDVKRDSRNNALKAKAQSHSKLKDLEEKLAAAESELEGAESKIYDLKESLADEESFHSKTIHEKEQTLDELEAVKDSLAAAENAISGLRAENLALRDQIDEMDNANESLEEQKTTILANLDPLKETVDTSSQLIETLETEIASLKSSIQERDSQISELVSDLAEARATADALLEQKRSLFTDADSLKEAVEASQQVIESLEMDLQIANAESDVLREKLADVQHETGEVTATLVRESSEKKLKGKAFEAKLRVLEKHKMELAKESSENRLKWKAFDTKFRHLTQENELIQSKLDEQTKIVYELEQQIQVWREDSEKASDNYHRLENSLEAVKLKLEIEQENVLQLEKFNSSLIEEKSEIESELKNFWETETDLKRQLGEADATCDRLRAERRQWQTHCSELETSESNLIQQITSLTETVQKREQECHSLKDRLAVLESGASEVTKEFAKELSNLRMHFNAVDKKNKDLKSENESLKQNMATLTSENVRLTAQSETMETHMEKIESTYETTIAGLTRDVESWRSGCDRQQSAVEEFQQTIEKLRTENQELKNDCSQSKIAFDEMQEQTKVSSNFLESTSQKLEDVKKELDSLRSESTFELEELRKRKTTAENSVDSLKMRLAFVYEEAGIILEADEIENSEKMDARFDELLDWIDSSRNLLKTKETEFDTQKKMLEVLQKDRAATITLISAYINNTGDFDNSNDLESAVKALIDHSTEEKDFSKTSLERLENEKTNLLLKSQIMAENIAKLEEETHKKCQDLEVNVSEQLENLKISSKFKTQSAETQATLDREIFEAKMLDTSSSQIHLQTKLTELEHKHIAVSNELKTTAEMLQKSQKDLAILNEKLLEHDKCAATRQEKIRGLEENNEKLQLLITTTSDKQVIAERECDETKAKLTEKEFIQAELQATVDGLRSENEELRSKVVLTESKLTQLQVEESENVNRRSTEHLVATVIADEQIAAPNYTEASEKIQQLTAAIEEIRVERDRLVQDRQNLCHEILALNSQIQEAEGNLEAKDIALEGFQESTTALVNQVEALQKSQRTAEVAELQDMQMQLQQEKNVLDEKITLLEEENQLLRHCLNEAEQIAESRGIRVEELDLLCTAQKGVISKLRDQLSLMDGTLSTLKRHKEATMQDIHVQKGQLESDFSEVHSKLELMIGEATTKDRELEELRARTAQVDDAYKSLSDYYTSLQTAYTTLYEQHQDVLKTSSDGNSSELGSQTRPDTKERDETVPKDLTEERKETMKLKAKVKKLQLELTDLKHRSSQVSSELADHEAASSITVEMRKQFEKSLEEKNQEIEGLIQHLQAVKSSHEDKQKVKENFERRIHEILAEVSGLKTEKDNLSQQIENFVTTNVPTIKNLEAEVMGYSQHVLLLGEKLSSKKRDSDYGKEKYESLREAYKNLEEKLKNLSETSDLKTEELDTLKKMYYQLEADRSRIELENQELRRNSQSRETSTLINQPAQESFQTSQSPKMEDAANYDEIISLLQERLSVVTSDSESLAQKLSQEEKKSHDALKEVDSLSETLEKLSLDHEDLQQRFEAAIQKNSSLDEPSCTTETKALSCETVDKQLSTDEISLKKDFEEDAQAVEGLKAELTASRLKLINMEQQITLKEENLLISQDEAEDLKMKLFEALEEKKGLLQEVLTYKNENTFLQEQLAPLKDLLAVKKLLMDKLTSLEETCEQIHQERKELMEKIDTVEKQLAECEQEKMQMQEDSISKIAQARNSESQLRETIQSLQTQLSNASQTSEIYSVEEIAPNLAARESETETLRTRIEELETEKEEAVWDLQNQITMGETDRKKTEQELSRKTSELEEVYSRFESLIEVQEELKIFLETMFDYTADLSSQAVSERFRAIQDERQELETLKRRAEQSTEDKRDLSTHIEALTTEVAMLKETLLKREEDQTNLKADETGSGEIILEIQNYKDKIEELEKELEERAAQFKAENENSSIELESMKTSLLETTEEFNSKTEELVKTIKDLELSNKELIASVAAVKKALCQLQGIELENTTDSIEEIAESLSKALTAWRATVNSRETQFADVQKQWEEAVAQRDAAISQLQTELQSSLLREQEMKTNKTETLQELAATEKKLDEALQVANEASNAMAELATILNLTETPAPEPIFKAVKALQHQIVEAMGTHTEELSSLTSQLESKTQNIEKLNHEIDSNQSELVTLLEKCKSQEQCLEEHQKKLSEAVTALEKLENVFLTGVDISSEPHEFVNSVKLSYGTQADEFDRLTEQIQEREHEISELKQEIATLRTAVRECENAEQGKSKTIADLQSSLELLTCQITVANELMDALSRVLKIDSSDPQKIVDAANSLVAECEQSTKAVTEAENTKTLLSDLNQQLNERRRVHQENQATIEILKNQLSSQAIVLDQTSQKLAEIEKLYPDLEIASGESEKARRDLEIKFAEVMDSSNETKESLEQHENTIKSLNSELEQLRMSYQQKESEIRELQIVHSSAVKKAPQETETEIQKLQETLNATNNTVNQLEAELIEKQDQIENLNGKLINLEQNFKIQKDSLREMEDERTTLTTQLEDALKKESYLSQELKQYEDLNLKMQSEAKDVAEMHRQEINSLNSKLEQLRSDLHREHTKVQELEELHSSVGSDSALEKTKSTMKIQELQDLLSMADDVSAQTQEKVNNLQKELENSQDELKNQKLKLSAIQTERDTVSTRLEEIVESNQSLASKLENAEALTCQIQSESFEKPKEYEERTSKLHDSVSTLEATTASQEIKIQQLLDELHSEREASSNSMERLKKQLQEAAEVKESVQLQQQSYDSEEQERQHTALRKEVSSLKTTVTEFQNKLAQVKAEKDAIENKRKNEGDEFFREKEKLSTTIQLLNERVLEWEKACSARENSLSREKEELQRITSTLNAERDEAVRRSGELLEKVNGMERKMNNYELKLAQWDVLAEKLRESEQLVSDLRSEKEKNAGSMDEMRNDLAESRVDLERLTAENIQLEEKVKLLKDEVQTVTSRENIQARRMETQQSQSKGKQSRRTGPGSQSSLTSMDTSSTVIEAPHYQQEAQSSLQALLSDVGESLPELSDNPSALDEDFFPESLRITLPLGSSDTSSQVRSMLTRHVKNLQLWLRSQSLRRSWTPWAMRWIVLIYLVSLHYMIMRCWLG